ncbi:hypothetical protein OS493_003068 [Desmophyllum pertusum]|uniref:G-protein coupled receptors family 1 profile domain-containing protein n=1 Tax=Desmophyllum pertusum TaxID=174260 RepID=A0A9W9YGV3_9CNID|nr:hypothetical protein OS493_003068 [Desmophyllum pertusum]
MTAISLDRYYAFTLRLRYRQVVTFKRVVFLLAACWVFGLIWPLSWLLSEKIAGTVVTVGTFCCIVITSISYIKITIGIRRHQRQILAQQTIPAPQQHGGNHFSIGQYKKSLNTMQIRVKVCSYPGVSSVPEPGANRCIASTLDAPAPYCPPELLCS